MLRFASEARRAPRYPPSSPRPMTPSWVSFQSCCRLRRSRRYQRRARARRRWKRRTGGASMRLLGFLLTRRETSAIKGARSAAILPPTPRRGLLRGNRSARRRHARHDGGRQTRSSRAHVPRAARCIALPQARAAARQRHWRSCASLATRRCASRAPRTSHPPRARCAFAASWISCAGAHRRAKLGARPSPRAPRARRDAPAIWRN